MCLYSDCFVCLFVCVCIICAGEWVEVLSGHLVGGMTDVPRALSYMLQQV